MVNNVLTMGIREMIKRIEVNVKKMTEVCEESPSTSLRQVARKVEMPKSAVHRIMRSDVDLFPYKTKINQPLMKFDGLSWFDFANTMISKVEFGEIEFNWI